MKSINIRKAAQADWPRIMELIRELAVFEREPDAVSITEADLEQYGSGSDPFFTCFVAETDGQVQAMALCYPRFSTWKGITLHLEDLIVSQEYRGKGLGSTLYRKVISHAFDTGLERVEWVVLDWNTPAVDFYINSGANVMREWNTVQMDRTAMKNYLHK